CIHTVFALFGVPKGSYFIEPGHWLKWTILAVSSSVALHFLNKLRFYFPRQDEKMYSKRKERGLWIYVIVLSLLNGTYWAALLYNSQELFTYRRPIIGLTVFIIVSLSSVFFICVLDWLSKKYGKEV